MDQPIIQPIPVCEARTGYLPDAYGFATVYCLQTRGLRRVIDGNGHAHYGCSAAHHMEQVRVQVRRTFPVATSQGELSMSFGR